MIQGEFDEIGQLFFEIELVAGNNEIFPINALLDTGSTEWLAIDKQDLEALEWEQIGTRQVVTARGITTFENYAAKVIIDGEEFIVPAVAGADFRETIIGVPWLRRKRLVVDFPTGELTLG
ncbi:MAG: aspartyl protease [Kamptonema sp. SIO1D9]|nr:aspartyl protease [Kamptonema sp. SIO1D9]